jgi:hypothetical protein
MHALRGLNLLTKNCVVIHAREKIGGCASGMILLSAPDHQTRRRASHLVEPERIVEELPG